MKSHDSSGDPRVTTRCARALTFAVIGEMQRHDVRETRDWGACEGHARGMLGGASGKASGANRQSR